MLEGLLMSKKAGGTKGGLLVSAGRSVASDECFVSEGSNVSSIEVCRMG